MGVSVMGIIVLVAVLMFYPGMFVDMSMIFEKQ